MTPILLNQTAWLVYEAVHAATAAGTRVFEGHLRVDVDHAQVCRDIARMVALGVLACEPIDPGVRNRGRRLRLLVPPARIAVAGRRTLRDHRRPAPGEPDDPSPRLLLDQVVDSGRRARALADFEAAWLRAFPQGARHHDDPAACRPEPRLRPARADARVLWRAAS